MKKSRILWVGLLVLGWPMMGWGQVCNDLGDPEITDRLEAVIDLWKKYDKPKNSNRETYQLFASLREYALPARTEAELKKAQSILALLAEKRLGESSSTLRDDMSGICKRCLKTIKMNNPSGGEVSDPQITGEVKPTPPEPRPLTGKTDNRVKPIPPNETETSYTDWIFGILATLLIGLLFWANRHRITAMLGEAESSYSSKTAGSNQYDQKTTGSDFSANRTTGTIPNQENEQVNGLIRQLLAVQNRLADAELRINALSVQNPNRAFIEQTVENYLQERARKTDTLLVKPSPTVAAREMPKEPNGFTNIDSQPGVFYMASPSPDGSFSVGNQSPVCRPGQSIYEFKVMADNPDKAEFLLIDSPETLRRILNLIETYVEPVCTSINGYDSNARRIFTDDYGLVERQNDRWVVKSKAKIRYV